VIAVTAAGALIVPIPPPPSRVHADAQYSTEPVH
jgi:hypothetical protein